MRKKKGPLLAVVGAAILTLAAGLFLSLAKTGDEAAPSARPLNIPFKIAVGERVQIAATGWTLLLDSVSEDSRCPEDAVCVWAGQVTVSILATQAAGDAIGLEVTLGPATDAEAAFGSFSVTVLSVSPHPRTDSPILQAEYIAELVVAEAQLSSGVQGLVTIGPVCPVQRPGKDCSDRPYEAELVVEDTSGQEVARTRSAFDGRFNIALLPGDYVLLPLSPPDSPLPHAEPVSFQVQPNRWQRLEIVYDSGIR